MTTQQLKCFAIEQAVRLVSTQDITNKTKAVLDVANDIVRYVTCSNENKIEEDEFDDLEHIQFDDHIQKYT